jgi:hypothetical protein
MAGKYAMVEKVQIEKVDDKNVTFATRSGTRSGDRDECLRRTFTCPVSEVWTHPITGAPAPVAMQPGAVGNLFLSGNGLQTANSDGYPIYGIGTPLLRIKYPDEAAISQLGGELRVIPTSIVVHGTRDGGRSFFDVELLGPDAADAQDIAWNGAEHVALRLTARGAKRLHLPEHPATLEVWPTRITVTGAPASDPGDTGSIDILDTQLASQGQHVKFAHHGAPISLALTQLGFAVFHVVPGMTDATPARHRISHRG